VRRPLANNPRDGLRNAITIDFLLPETQVAITATVTIYLLTIAICGLLVKKPPLAKAGGWNHHSRNPIPTQGSDTLLIG
jgi:hypothetical protein